MRERGNIEMKRNMLTKMLKRTLSFGLIIGMIGQMLPVSVIEASQSDYEASYIQELKDLLVDHSGQIDNSVMFQLPEGIDDDEEISVIITVDTDTIMEAYDGTDKTMSFKEYATSSDDAMAITQEINDKKADILSRLEEEGVSYKTGDDYNTLLSGFEILIKAEDFTTTCKSLGEGENAIVSEVYESCKTELVENTVNIYEETGIFDGSNSGFDGSGMVVAVLDTGLDYNHSAFSTGNFTSDKLGLTYEDVKAVLKDTVASELVDGLTVDDVYISEKVPFGFDYADSDADPYSTHNNHGTHVSGVIVGKDDTITGVAPNAQLVSMKTFSDITDTARSTWILSALEDCVVLGVDVINMSLGTACGFSRESDEEVLSGVYDKIREAGIAVIVAGSNSYNSAYGSEANGNLGLTSNPDTGTVGSPGTYEGVMSVASISGTKTPYILYKDTIIYFSESNNNAGEENKFFDTLLGDEDSIEIEYVVIPGVGRTADYTGLDVKDKIVLVRRGDNTFEEKAIIAQQQGAAGIIIYNNVSGDIKMNVGDATLAVCSISQDNGEMLVEKGNGKLKIASSQTSGPFISDFSSWGPTPDLGIKPEITAHGGNILSAVTGGSYDRLSGTSMACPNLAGIVLLLRQYVVENFPEIADDNVKVTALVYQLLMSTADIALNTNGLPYAVRKQGAGLANLEAALATTAYITTKDADGNVMDKAKLELGDDPDKTGEYELVFTINNFGDKKLSYKIGSYVMTEGVSDTKTSHGETTVTEEAHILDGAKMEVVSVEGGKLGFFDKTKVTVDKGESAEVTVKITLSDEDKAYLDESFENGMYVEGFITLEAKSGTKVDLNVPYLAFYGDWTVAPMFDLDYFETHADELDESLAPEDKTMPDAYATRPVGGVSEDYVSYLGTYYFLQDPADMTISADRAHISLSNQDGTIHSLRYVWAGLLRNAKEIKVTITDATTGEVVFETVDTDVRKSYGDGGSIYPANVEIEFDTMDYNFPNNTELLVTLEGTLDYGDGGASTNEKNSFTFPITIDFEAPTVTDVKYYYEFDKTLNKNRLYAEVGVYDNHYAMASQLGYVAWGEDENGNATPEIKLFEQYMTPIYSERNGVTYVKYELTDYIYKIKENAITPNSFVVTTYDYALNYATYEIGLPDDYTDFYFDGLEEGLTLSPNEVYSLDPIVEPITEWGELLEYSSSKPGVVRVVNDKLVAVRSGSSIIKISDPTTGKSTSFTVTVLGEEDEGYRRFDKPVADIFNLDGFGTLKAYYMLNSDDKELGDTGSNNFFEGNFSLTMYPSESVYLTYTLDSYFPNDTTVEFESSNEAIVSIKDGVITAVEEGFASVTIKVVMDGKSTYYSETVSIEVKNPYVQTGGSLTHYYGNGGLVTIPDDLGLTEIGNFAFSNFDYVAKTEEELAFDDAEATKQWYIGDNTITKVIIPEGVKKIGAYAFANLTALEEVVLPSTLESIEYGAFVGCTSLEKITFSGDNNLKIISQNAFENCDLQDTLELPSICVISNYAFAGNQDLEGVVLGDTLISIGSYAFAGCKDLENVDITSERVKYGTYAFTGCESLTEFYVNSAVLPEGMFYECEDLATVTIGPDVNEIGEFAFRDTAISKYVISEGNKAYKVQSADYIISADGETLMAVSPLVEGEFTVANIGNNNVTAIGNGALSHNTEITSVVLKNVTAIGDYGLASNENLVSYEFGTLETIGEYAFFETGITAVPAFTADTEIGKYAFAFTKITSVTVPDNTVLAEGVFSENMSLETVVIGNDVTIGKYAFAVNKDNSFTITFENVEGGRHYSYDFKTALTSLTIGNNAEIGEHAFAYAASLETVTLGENAEIGYMAFYNAQSLKNIDLSKAISIGDYAFSGDVYNVCLDDSMAYAAVSPEGTYIYTYHAPALTDVDLSAATSVGAHAFSYCLDLVNVNLGAEITEIPEYAFAGCSSLQTINLAGVTTIGDYAFMEADLRNVDLTMTETIGEYGFVNNKNLTNVTFNPEGTDTAEGSFTYCESLATVTNLGAAEHIGAYAFAYTALTEVDLTAAVSVGDYAFMKENLTPFKVTLGEDIESLGDNPFAMCKLDTFSVVGTEEINDIEIEVPVYSYEITDTVKVVDGSLYSQVPNGWELITYTGLNPEDVVLAEDTVRVTGMALAGSDVTMVTLPYTIGAVGHKAFFACDDLEIVVFQCFDAPILEEEYDPTYYDSLEHIPGSGDYGTYTDYDGTEVQIEPMGLIPYFMWNVSGGMYSNVFYGANFVDYVGYVEEKLMMVRPVNGEHYDSFIMNQYFDFTLEGPAAPDDVALAAIRAIKAIPERVTLDDRGLVEAARAAYDKIATIAQQALVTNYADLVTAEQRIKALAAEAEVPVVAEPEDNPILMIVLIVALVVLVVCGVLGFIFKNQILEFWNAEKTTAVREKIANAFKAFGNKIKGFVVGCKNKVVGLVSKSKEKAAEKKASKEVNKVVEESKPEEAKCEPEEVDENETEN